MGQSVHEHKVADAFRSKKRSTALLVMNSKHYKSSSELQATSSKLLVHELQALHRHVTEFIVFHHFTSVTTTMCK